MKRKAPSVPVRIYHAPRQIVIAAPTPGLEAEDISITIDDQFVTINGKEAVWVGTIEISSSMNGVLAQLPRGQSWSISEWTAHKRDLWQRCLSFIDAKGKWWRGYKLSSFTYRERAR